MGISLNNTTPAVTYPALIKFGDNFGLTTTLKNLSDGEGNDLPIQVKNNQVNIVGTLTQNGQPVTTPPSGVAGAIQFSDGSAFASDATNLFWDNSNKRLGVGTNTGLIAQAHFQSNTSLANEIFVGCRLAVSGTRYDGLRIGTNSNGVGFIQGNSGLNLTSAYPIILQPNGSDVGIGMSTGTITARLQVRGSGSTSATNALLVQNSSGTDLLRVQDNGFIVNDLGIGFANNSRTIIFSDSVAGVYGSGVGIASFGGFGVKTFDGSAYNLAFVVTGNGNQRVGIGSTLPNASAKLDVTSTTQGFLPPRMTTTQKNAITSPASGLVVYDSTTNKLCCYNGSTWNDLF